MRGRHVRAIEVRACDVRACDVRACNVRACEVRACEERRRDVRACESAMCELAMCELVSCEHPRSRRVRLRCVNSRAMSTLRHDVLAHEMGAREGVTCEQARTAWPWTRSRIGKIAPRRGCSWARSPMELELTRCKLATRALARSCMGEVAALGSRACKVRARNVGTTSSPSASSQSIVTHSS